MAVRIPLANYDAALEAAKKAILAGGLVIYPTDTIYGIGCDATSSSAVEKVYAAKRRKDKPLSIIVSDLEMLHFYCNISGKQEEILQKLLPGPYTFILPLKKRLPVSPTLSVGVRVPEHLFARQVAKDLRIPIVSTSANLSGQKEAAESSELCEDILAAADLLIDGGRCKYAMGSTIIDLIEMKVLRRGAVRQEDRIEFG